MHVMHRVAVRYAVLGISGGDGIEESSSWLASTNGPRFVTFTVVGVSRALTARRFSLPYYGGTNDPFFFLLSFSPQLHTEEVYIAH